jgi:hypothetical protein
MRITMICFAVSLVVVCIAASEMPSSFYTAMQNMRTENILCVKNYEAGASITEAYKDFESLEKETEIISRSATCTNADKNCTPALLEATISSNVVGTAHVSWQSLDPIPDHMGRHFTYSRSIEDLTGAFSIEKFIQLWSNSTSENASLDWLSYT